MTDFSLHAPYIPDSNENSNPFSSKVKYITKLVQKNNNDSILSEYEEDEEIAYNPNWADEF